MPDSGVIQQLDSMKQVLPLIGRTMPDDVLENAEDSGDCPSRHLYGYFIDDLLVGCCGYTYDEGRYSISWTAVDPRYQGKGIGRKLLCYTIDRIKALGGKSVWVETYEHPSFFRAIGFYLEAGFRLCGYCSDYLRDGSAVLYLRKML